MFNKATALPSPLADHDVIDQGDTGQYQLVPLSVLSLDHPEPANGWDAYLTVRGVEVVTDDIGRRAISRDDAKQLFDERRQVETQKREMLARQEQEAVERDRAFREALPKGTHWTDIPVGVSAAQVWVQAEKDAKPKRRSPLEDALAGEGTVYRPLPDES